MNKEHLGQKMGVKEEFYYPSCCGNTQIHAVIHVPQGEIKAILQLSHGMVEFIERYDDFAAFLNQHGYLVVGNDHLGHGKSVNSEQDYGYFAEPDGNAAVLKDLHQLTLLTKQRYPSLPYFLLGHSMGSFYARQYLCEYGSELNGAIIMGTGGQPRLMVRAGKLLCAVLAKSKGWRYRSTLVDNIAFGSYNKRFEPARTDKDWLSKDEEKVDAYIADKRCGFLFTLNAYYSMFSGIDRLYDKQLLQQMPRQLPVFFVAGEDDPVGDFGKGVQRAYRSFEQAGMQNIRLKLYPGDRHEILNETDRDLVYQDILNWMEQQLQARS